jgi:hypothetical protein
MNAHAPLLKEIVVALGVATIVIAVTVTVAVGWLRRKLVG